jgi:hypothetical protein
MIPTAKPFQIRGYLSISFPPLYNYIALFFFKNISLRGESIDTVLRPDGFLCESEKKREILKKIL